MDFSVNRLVKKHEKIFILFQRVKNCQNYTNMCVQDKTSRKSHIVTHTNV